MKPVIIVNNKEDITCSSHCHLFNKEYNCCSILSGLSYNDPKIPKRCSNFQYKKSESYMNSSAIQLDSSRAFDFTVVGERYIHEFYPKQPEVAISGVPGELYWYVDPINNYGCWILNESLSGLMTVPSSRKRAETGWAEEVYRSPIPLHDHKCHPNLRGRICWYVDHDGWAQYGVLIGGHIGYIEHPRSISTMNT